MNICFNTFLFNKIKGTSLYTYTYNLIHYLNKYYPQAKYHLIWDPSYNIDTWFLNKNIEYIEKFNSYSYRESSVKILKYMEEKKMNLFHCINNGFTLSVEERPKDYYKYIVSVHDLIAITNKELVDIKYSNNFNSIFASSIDKADKIIATSSFIKKDIIKYYKIEENKIDIIYPICSNIFRPLDSSIATNFIKEKYNIANKFLLYCGSIHVRKNIEIIIKVFNNIRKEIENLKLVIIGRTDGKRSDYFLKLKKLCSDLNISDEIIFTGIIDYHDMPYFYNAAELVLNFSTYEGFPMSSVEALSCGTPVICSDIPIFQEVVGKYSQLVNIDSHREIKDVILSILIEKNNRNDLYLNSLNIFEKFSPEVVINKLIGLYESVLY